jgi:hypothetical protein
MGNDLGNQANKAKHAAGQKFEETKHAAQRQ